MKSWRSRLLIVVYLLGPWSLCLALFHRWFIEQPGGDNLMEGMVAGISNVIAGAAFYLGCWRHADCERRPLYPVLMVYGLMPVAVLLFIVIGGWVKAKGWLPTPVERGIGLLCVGAWSGYAPGSSLWLLFRRRPTMGPTNSDSNTSSPGRATVAVVALASLVVLEPGCTVKVEKQEVERLMVISPSGVCSAVVRVNPGNALTRGRVRIDMKREDSIEWSTVFAVRADEEQLAPLTIEWLSDTHVRIEHYAVTLRASDISTKNSSYGDVTIEYLER